MSCCMDGSVKVVRVFVLVSAAVLLIGVPQWSPEHPHSLTTLQAHHACVYQALFSPHQPDLVATCSGDGTIRFFRPPLTLLFTIVEYVYGTPVRPCAHSTSCPKRGARARLEQIPSAHPCERWSR